MGKPGILVFGGASIRFSEELRANHNLYMVMEVKGRFISCKAQIVWSTDGERDSRRKSRGGIGVRFTKMMLNDLKFLHSEISSRL
jgi:hypothetical protein